MKTYEAIFAQRSAWQAKLRDFLKERELGESAELDVVHGPVMPNADLIITPNEVCGLHGTGVLVERLFGHQDNILNIRSFDNYEGLSMGKVQILLHHPDQSRPAVFKNVSRAIRGHTIKRILCVPFFIHDVLTAVAAKELLNVPMAVYLMDDQNIFHNRIPDDLMREMIFKSDVRFTISPEMRDAYEIKYGRRFGVLPPTVSPEYILSKPIDPKSLKHPGVGVMIGNVWTVEALDALRKLTRESKATIHWYGNASRNFLPYDGNELAQDGIFLRGFVPERELARHLREYSYTIIPSGSASEAQDTQWLAALSLPSRLPYVMAVGNIPAIVLGSEDTPASHFVRHFGVGEVCPYKSEEFTKTISDVCKPEVQKKMRENAAKAAPQFSSAGVAEWIWDSLRAGQAIDDRYDTLFARDEKSLTPWVEFDPPKDIYWSFDDLFCAMKRLHAAGLRPDFVFDVGSSTAIWSDVVSRVFQKSRYILVEPLMSRYKQMASWYFDRHPEFELVEKAVSDKTGKTSFNVSHDLYGSTLLKAADARSYEAIDVEITTLDEIAKEKEIKGRGLIKIDVQYAEHLVLAGGLKMLEQVDVVMLELSFFRYATEAKVFTEMVQYMDSLGYRLFDFVGGWRDPRDGTMQQTDAIFVKKGVLEK